jgi:hypothetical protein
MTVADAARLLDGAERSIARRQNGGRGGGKLLPDVAYRLGQSMGNLVGIRHARGWPGRPGNMLAGRRAADGAGAARAARAGPDEQAGL